MSTIHRQVSRLDELLQAHASALGADYTAYRNHCYRVLNLAVALSGSDQAEVLDKIAIAVAFHDLGIWTDGSFDYLAPSERRAQAWLAQAGLESWSSEITRMIREHHRIRPYRTEPAALVEALREADWVDVSLGLFRAGLPRDFLRELSAAFPNAGFHKRLVQLSLRRLLTHPWSPLPMLRF